jgi:hypothetical protein
MSYEDIKEARVKLAAKEAHKEDRTNVDDLLHYIGSILFADNVDVYEIGLGLSAVSRAFIARAPSKQIARVTLHEIAKPYFHKDWG